LSERESGFWAFPTSSAEIQTIFPNAQGRGFGPEVFGSYTITWSALRALEHALGDIPSTISALLLEIFQTNSATKGAYGRPLPEGALDDPSSPDLLPSARHTAFALLTRMRYLKNFRPDDWTASASWLIEHQDASGGWSYRVSDPETEALSTAACVAALAVFLTTRTDEVLKGKVETCIRKGWDTLRRIRQQDGLWKAHIPGVIDIEETANILDLLSLTEVSERLDALKLAPRQTLDPVRASLIQLAGSSPGWPTKIGGEPALDATINVLVATFDDYASSQGASQPLQFKTISEWIINQMKDTDGGLRLQSWDWAMLLRLSAYAIRFIGGSRMQGDEYQKLETKVRALRRESSFFAKIIYTVALEIPEVAHRTFLFIMSRGVEDKGASLLKLARLANRILPGLTGLVEKFVLKRLEKAATG
jgi:hypothetical protein